MVETPLLRGILRGLNGQVTSGQVSIEAAGNGGYLLRVTDLSCEEQPGAKLVLTRDGCRENGVDVGDVPRFTGDMTLPIPGGIDPFAYNTVLIWCDGFHLGLGEARL